MLVFQPIRYIRHRRRNKDTSKMLLTVSSFGESHRRRSPAVAFIKTKKLGIFRFESGENHKECRPLIKNRLNPNAAVVTVHDGFHNRQSKTGASRTNHIAAAIKLIKDMRLLLERDARSRISHRENNLVVFRLQLNVNCSTFRRVFDRITDQVIDHLPDSDWICAQGRQIRCKVLLYLQIFLMNKGFQQSQ